MRSFPGQLTSRGLNACASFVWTLVPFYIKTFLSVKERALAFFVVDVA
jgi:hypothetical protein